MNAGWLRWSAETNLSEGLIMDQQGKFTLPANTNFGVSAFTNSTFDQTVKILIDGQVKATFTGHGMSNNLIGSQVLNSGKGAVQVTVGTGSGGASPSSLISGRAILANRVNFGMVAADEGSDGDFNDSIIELNWPLR